MVVLFHMYAFAGDAPAWPVEAAAAPFSWLAPYAWMGWIGVQIFFVLSGFVIAASAQNSTAITFLKKRAIRLLPALWLSAALALAARLYWGEPLVVLLEPFLKTLVLSPKGPYIDGVVWTLVVEAAFYMCTALVIFASPRLGGNRQALRMFALTLGAMSAAFTIIFWSNQTLGIGPSLPLGSFAFDVLLMRQGMFFAIGMLLFQIVDQGAARGDWLIVFLLCGMGALQILNKIGDAWALVPIAIWGSATALIFLGAMYGDKLITKDVRPLMRPIGLMTYPLYLNHFVLGQALLPLLTPWVENGAALFILFLSILLANAWIMAQYPEKLIQSQLKRVVLGKPADRPIPHDQAVV